MSKMEVARLGLALLSLLLAVEARADRGALTVDAGAAGAMLSLSPPVGTGPRVDGTVAQVQLGVRYAVRNWLEFGASGFWQNSPHYYFDDTTVTTGNGSFPGQLQTETSAWGAGVGVRFVTGSLVRPFLAMDVGLVSRSYSHLDHVNVSAENGPSSYGLDLPEVTRAGAFLSPALGLEWEATDRFAVGIAVKAMFEMTDGAPRELVVPVTLSYSWYLL